MIRMIIDMINRLVEKEITILVITPENLGDFVDINIDEVTGVSCNWNYVRDVLLT